VAVLGVDGWQVGWVGARLTDRAVQLLDLRTVDAVLAVDDVEVVGIDMPIGLSADGVRACDEAARHLLTPFGAASSVLSAGALDDARGRPMRICW
jgi:predicted RNase H-like nuclease